MYFNGTDHKTVFILGAGATRGAVGHVLVNRKRLRPPLNSDFFKVAETFGRARGATSLAARRLGQLKQLFKTDLAIKGTPSMEDAFSLLYVANDLPDIYRRRPGPKPQPGKMRELQYFLDLVFQILCALENNSAQENGYDRLVSRLGPRDTIISLNYDTLLDSALVNAGWDPRSGYCLTGESTGKCKWRSPRDEANLSGIRLLKLHGSLNWFVRGTLANISEVFEKKPVRVTKPRSNGMSNHMRQIIPPIYGKVFRHAHWRQLWRSAYEGLCQADTLVVIGCSLVDTDFHLRALISRVRRERKEDKRPFRRAFFVDRSLPIRRKWIRSWKGTVKRMSHVKEFNNFLRTEL